MKILSNLVVIAAAVGFAGPVTAQNALPDEGGSGAEETAPPATFTFMGDATLTSDYRFRGLSQTNRRVAIQGTGSVIHASGLYATVWGSSIDDYVANGGDVEIDLSAGYRRTFNGTTIDGGVLYYYYPGAGAVDSDFFEPYVNVAHSIGPIGVKVGGNFAWKQHGLATPTRARAGGVYGYAELAAAIPTTGFTVTGRLGHSFVRNHITGDAHYTDWRVTAAYVWKALTISVGYVDTDHNLYSYPLRNGHDRNIGKGGVVGAVGVTF